MKILFAILICLMLLGCGEARAADFYYFGMNGKWLKTAKWSHVAAGMASSVASHFAGHMGYAYARGLDVTVSGTSETLCGEYTDSEARNFARAGFVLQHGVNLALITFKSTRETDFTRGFTIATALETWTYRVRHKDDGDFDMIDRHGGDGDREHLFFCALSCHEILRIEW